MLNIAYSTKVVWFEIGLLSFISLDLLLFLSVVLNEGVAMVDPGTVSFRCVVQRVQWDVVFFRTPRRL